MALISFAVTAKLICAFVFAYADCWFSHGVAQMFELMTKIIVVIFRENFIRMWVRLCRVVDIRGIGS